MNTVDGVTTADLPMAGMLVFAISEASGRRFAVALIEPTSDDV